MGYASATQEKNIAWLLPRPKRDHYRGGMPLYAEKWLLDLARDMLNKSNVKVLNVFCGMNTEGFRVDLNSEVKPDLLCDIHELSKYHSDKYDIIFADPDYSDEEAKKLHPRVKVPHFRYRTWTAECDKLLNDGGLLVIYHKLLVANPDSTKYRVVKRVFIGHRVWHLPRVAVFFQKNVHSKVV